VLRQKLVKARSKLRTSRVRSSQITDKRPFHSRASVHARRHPLGIRAHRRETTFGIAVALILVILYYTSSSSANLWRHGRIVSSSVLWLPNFIFQALGAVLLWRAIVVFELLVLLMTFFPIRFHTACIQLDFALSSASWAVSNAYAEVRPHGLFSDNMSCSVECRSCWGWADDGEKVMCDLAIRRAHDAKDGSGWLSQRGERH